MVRAERVRAVRAARLTILTLHSSLPPNAIDATLSPWSRRLDGGEAQKRAQKRAQKLAPAGSGSRELAQLLPRRSQGPLKRGLTKFSGQFS